MKLCWDTRLGLISESEDGADVFLTIQFLRFFDSFSPWETKEVDDLCCRRGSQIGMHIPLSYTNHFEVALSLVCGVE